LEITSILPSGPTGLSISTSSAHEEARGDAD
jgi:hypothetical protein